MNKITESIDNRITDLEKELKYTLMQKDMFSAIKGPDFRYNFVPGTSARLVIYDLNDLTAARRFMKKACGSWSDAFHHVFSSYERAIATWKNNDCPIQIWLETSIDNFPDNLLKDGCKWTKTEETQYRITCDLT
jgi:hypothetical protein